MAYKRSRADFEADSIFAVYGTPLPPFDPDVRDDGSYVPVWKQDAVDERGRKRFHGAFTGGFSAGYYNTVGSKEGWTPATFISSRSNRAKDKQENAQRTAQDFMDDEDIADQEQSRQLQTNDSFAGLGSTADDARRRDALVDLMRPKVSIGIQLLQKMGWREGQGIGQKVLRKARTDGPVNGNEMEHRFAPKNTKMIAFIRKTNRKGLGFQGESSLSIRVSDSHDANALEEDDDIALSRSKFQKDSKPWKKTGFGVGILNDNGSDDEDPYDIGPKISYNRTVGPVKKAKKPSKLGGLIGATSSNPLLATKPVFIKKKKSPLSSSLRKCHDGRLPLDGFVLYASPYNPSFNSNHPPPKVPADWKSSKAPLSTEAAQDTIPERYKSTTDAARSSSLNPAARASLLGETQLPGKSVFAYLSASARDHLAAVTGNANLPQAGNEPVPVEYRKSDKDRIQQQWTFVPSLEPSLANAALDRADAPGGGFMPYAYNADKRTRYRSFLELHAGKHTSLPPRAPSATNEEWATEMREFAQAAQVFRPMSGLMASRFTSSSSSSAALNGDPALLITPSKPVDPAEQAAQMQMYGPLTRSSHTWVPTKLLCKRFGVRPPVSIDVDYEAADSSSFTHNAKSTAAQKVMSMALALPAPMSTATEKSSTFMSSFNEHDAPRASNLPAKVDVEMNEALERERPGDDLFKAVFGSDDDGDDDDDD
jgi:G patch domain-containing protein 1